VPRNWEQMPKPKKKTKRPHPDRKRSKGENKLGGKREIYFKERGSKCLVESGG